jgi:hypothetical protein
MLYADRYHQLKDLLDFSVDCIPVPGSRACIRNFSFTSDTSVLPPWMDAGEYYSVSGNFNFRYPVVVPDAMASYDKAIIILHGLNERNWNKHLPGALYLAQTTNRPVILFPLSFHMNRGLPEWSDTRRMSIPLALRKIRYPGIREASVVNFALSDRLTREPGRFVTSGFQSIVDLYSLMRMLRSGNHPLFVKPCTTSVFAYSISCMVMQVLMISNPGGILDTSRIVLFAGGCLFSDMQAVSRFIMDSLASDALKAYYLSQSGSVAGDRGLIFEDCEFGRAFSLMIDHNRQSDRDKALKRYQDQLQVSLLRTDKVIPAEGVIRTFGESFVRSGHLSQWDFPFPHSHENPFPVLNEHLHSLVDEGFRDLYGQAACFIAEGYKSGSGHRKTDYETATLSG